MHECAMPWSSMTRATLHTGPLLDLHTAQLMFLLCTCVSCRFPEARSRVVSILSTWWHTQCCSRYDRGRDWDQGSWNEGVCERDPTSCRVSAGPQH